MKRFSIAIVCMVSAAALPCMAAGTKADVIRLNNSGVQAISDKNLRLAADEFAAALKIEPENRLARQNLAIAQDTWGQQLKAKPEEALTHYHKALLLDFNDERFKKNADAAIKALGFDPNLFKDRVSIADNAAKGGDFTGAAAEYLVALALKDTPDIQRKLAEAYGHVEPFYRKAAAYENFQADTKFDNGSYVSMLEQQLKQNWTPSSDKVSRRAVLTFNIDALGHVTNVHIAHSSHQSSFDQEALQSVEKSGVLAPLPEAARGQLSLQTVFDYDAVTQNKSIASDVQSMGHEIAP
jgi:TonB family protein